MRSLLPIIIAIIVGINAAASSTPTDLKAAIQRVNQARAFASYPDAWLKENSPMLWHSDAIEGIRKLKKATPGKFRDYFYLSVFCSLVVTQLTRDYHQHMFAELRDESIKYFKRTRELNGDNRDKNLVGMSTKLAPISGLKRDELSNFFRNVEKKPRIAKKYKCWQSAYYLGKLALSVDNEREFRENLTDAANQGLNADAAYDLAQYYLDKLNFELACKWFEKAETLGSKIASLGLAESLHALGKFDDAKDALVRATSYGLAREQLSHVEAMLESHAVDEAIDENSSTSESSEDDDEEITPQPRHASLPSAAEHADAPAPLTLAEKNKIKWQKISRMWEERKRERKEQLVPSKDRERDFNDVKVFLSTNARNQLTLKNLPTIQGRISNLAIGRPGARFKALVHMPGHFSMRLSKKDRLVFRLPDGMTQTGISRIEIISVEGHYRGLKLDQEIAAADWAETRKQLSGSTKTTS